LTFTSLTITLTPKPGHRNAVVATVVTLTLSHRLGTTMCMTPLYPLTYRCSSSIRGASFIIAATKVQLAVLVPPPLISFAKIESARRTPRRLLPLRFNQNILPEAESLAELTLSTVGISSMYSSNCGSRPSSTSVTSSTSTTSSSLEGSSRSNKSVGSKC
jgi:hypothetical protein